MSILGWRAWFMEPDRTYTSAELEPGDLPGDGCLGVVAYLDLETPKTAQHTGETWYFWWQGPHGLVIGSNSDSREENERRYPGCVLVRGKWTTVERMHEVRREMQEAHECP